MVRVGRADEAVGVDLELRPRLAEARADAVAERLRVEALGLGLALDLEAVLVRAGEHERLVTDELMEAPQRVGDDGRVGGAEVRHVVHVVDRSRDVEASHRRDGLARMRSRGESAAALRRSLAGADPAITRAASGASSSTRRTAIMNGRSIATRTSREGGLSAGAWSRRRSRVSARPSRPLASRCALLSRGTIEAGIGATSTTSEPACLIHVAW